jgi:hypothetical protein
MERENAVRTMFIIRDWIGAIDRWKNEKSRKWILAVIPMAQPIQPMTHRWKNSRNDNIKQHFAFSSQGYIGSAEKVIEKYPTIPVKSCIFSFCIAIINIYVCIYI